MQQLRLGVLPEDAAANPLSRLLVGLITVVLGLGAAALIVLVVLPLVGIILSAAVGGVILAVAGVIMMIPLLLVAGTIVAFVGRTNARRGEAFRARTYWR
jgi:hypothetical protein